MDRQDLIAGLATTLRGCPAVRAAWLGGSEAFGRSDAHSDIDLVAVVPPEAVGEVFSALEAYLHGVAGIRARYHVPAAVTPDFTQRFYQLVDQPESLMIDVALMRPDRLAIWLDPVRHGLPVVLLDPEGLLVPVDDLRLPALFAERLEQIRARAVMYGHIPGKALVRGNLLEALDTWSRFLVAPLVEVLRARYCPRRQDFGMRYLPLDLPPEVYARLCALLLGADSATLGAKIDEARGWLLAELAQLER